MAKSLLEGMNMGSTGAPAKKAGKKNESGKLIFAVVLLVVAGVVVAWQMGVFGGSKLPPEDPKVRAAQEKEFEQQKTRTQELQKQNKAVTTGSS